MFKDFLKRFSLYSFVSLVTGTISFLLLPVLTKYLSPEDYGTLSIVNALILFTTILISFGVIPVLMVQFNERDKSEFQKSLKGFVFFTVVIVIVILSTVALCGLFKDEIFGVSISYLFIIPIISLLLAYYEIIQNIYIHSKETMNYVKVSLGKFSIEIMLTLLLIISFGMGWIGRIAALFITLILIIIIPLISFYRNGYFSGKVNLKSVKSLLGQGSHMIVLSVSVIAMNLSDRFFVEEMQGMSETGIYSIGYSVGSLQLVLGNSLIAIFRPDIYKMATNYMQNKLHLKKTAQINIAILLLGFVTILVGNKWVFQFLIDPKFSASQEYVAIIALGFLFWAICNFYLSYFIALKKGKIISLVSLFGIILNVLLNYLFILNFGTIGAAYATLFTFSSMAFTIYVIHLYLINKTIKVD